MHFSRYASEQRMGHLHIALAFYSTTMLVHNPSLTVYIILFSLVAFHEGWFAESDHL